jgi:uncharacterized protein
MAIAGEINLIVSEIVEEVVDVLTRKFAATPEEVAEARTIIASAARTIKPSVQLDVVKDDQDDNRIVECAVSAGSDYVVTGDRDLLRMERYDSIRLLKVAEFPAITLLCGAMRRASRARTPGSPAPVLGSIRVAG